MENGINRAVVEADSKGTEEEVQAPMSAVLKPKPVRLSPEQEMRLALTTCEEAYLDEVTDNRINGAVINMTYDQAVGRLNLLRAQRPENELIYRELIQSAIRKRGG